MFFGNGGGVDKVVEGEGSCVHHLTAHLAAADTTAGGTALLHFTLHVLAQAGAAVTLDHVKGGDIADDAVDAAVRRDEGLDVSDQVHQLLSGVGGVFVALPVAVQLGGLEELGGVDLDLIRGVAVVPQTGEILAVGIRGGTEQVGHPVQHDLEAGSAQEGHCAQSICAGVSALVEREDAVIQALGAHLQLGHTETAQPDQLVAVDVIRAGLDDQPDIAVIGAFV